jgi:hypothetical protein
LDEQSVEILLESLWSWVRGVSCRVFQGFVEGLMEIDSVVGKEFQYNFFVDFRDISLEVC